ncbi:MAG: hypothetical protein JOY51_09100 [Nevskia sp.]|nr:hypothetical protein [Nevskia sp.]
MTRLCLLCLAALLLAACGASGGLYLPDEGPKHDNPLKKDARKPAQQPQQSGPDSGQAPAPAANTPDQAAPTPQPQ